MALGSTRPLKEISKRNTSWSGGQRWTVHRADNLTTFMSQMSGNLGASTSWNPLRSAIGQYRDCCPFTSVTNSAHATTSKSNITFYVNKSAYYI